MAVSRAQYRPSGRPAGTSSGKPKGKYISPRVKLSALGKAYNKVRCFIIIGLGIYMSVWMPEYNIIVPQTVIIGGAIMTYLAIYYNKRT